MHLMRGLVIVELGNPVRVSMCQNSVEFIDVCRLGYAELSLQNLSVVEKLRYGVVWGPAFNLFFIFSFVSFIMIVKERLLSQASRRLAFFAPTLIFWFADFF